MAKLKDGTRVYGGLQVDQTLTVANITISGNLFVNGTTTSVDSTVTRVQDPIFELGGGANGAALTGQDNKERGILMHYYNGAAVDAFMGWHTSNGQFEFGKAATETAGNITIGTYGNVKADHYIGEGDMLGNITGANVTGTVASASDATRAVNVTASAQPNITSVGNLTGLQIGNATTAGNVVLTENGTLVASGNVSANYFLGNGSLLTGLLADTAKKTANGTSDVNIPTINGNITMSVGGTANVVVVTATGANVTGNLDVTANLTAGNITTSNTVGAGNVKVSSLTSTRVTFAGTDGLLVDDADLTFTTGTNTLAAGNLDVVGTANLGTIKSTGLTGGKIAYINNSNTFVTDSQLSYDDSSDKLSTGNLEITTLANVGSARINDLTGTRVPFVNSSNTLVDSTNFTFTTATDKLNTGNLELTGTANVNEAIIRSLTSTRVPFVDADKSLTDDTNFTFTTASSKVNAGNLELTNTANVDEVIVRTLTSTRVPFVDADKSLTDSTNFTFTTASSKVNAGNLELTNTANVDEVIVRTLTSTRIPFVDADKSLTDASGFTFTTASGLVNAANIEIANTANLLDVTIRSGGKITGNVTPSANVTYDLGSDTLRWKDLYLSGTSISLGSQTITSNSTTVSMSGDLSGANIFATANANVTGNVTGGNIITSNLVQGANVTATGNVFTNDIRARAGAAGITMTAGAGGSITLAPEGSGTVNVSSKKITNLATPTDASDAATKGYVDSTAQGLDVKNSVRLTTTGDRALTGLTAVDGVTPSDGDRILVRYQTTGSENGIYVARSGAWERSVDADTTGKITGGTFTFVEEGTLYADTGWVVTTNGTITIGTTAITWTQFSGAGAYTAGSGLTLNGGQFSVNTDGVTTEISGGNVIVKASAVFTTPNIGAATGTSLNLSTGTITANGALLTNINGANVSLVDTAKQVTEGTQSNITAVGTLTSLAVSGNVGVGTGTVIANAGVYTDGYYYANGSPIDFQTAAGNATEIQFKASGSNDLQASTKLTFDPTTSNLTVNGNIVTGTGSGGNITGANFVTANSFQSSTLTSGRVTFAGTSGLLSDDADLTFTTATNLLTAGNVAVTSLTSGRVTYASTDGKLVDSTNLTFNGTELKVTGTANITTSIATAALTATGTVQGGNLIADNLTTANALVISEGSTHRLISNATLFLGANDTLTAANISTTGNTSTGNLSVGTNITLSSGNITGANVISGTTLTGTLSTAAQTNITTVGTLAGVTATGVVDFTGTSNVALGAVGNVHITGGTSGQVLTTDGAGVLSWATNDTSRIINGTSNVSIPTVNGNVNIVSAGNTVIEVTGTGANIAGYVTATGNIQGNNITALANVIVQGATDATSAATGSIKTDGGISAKGNIYAGKSVGFADNTGNTASKAYIQFNTTANSLDFIFN